jgi:hypothetical protein
MGRERLTLAKTFLPAVKRHQQQVAFGNLRFSSPQNTDFLC